MCVALGAEQIIEIDEDGKVHGDISGVKRTRCGEPIGPAVRSQYIGS